MKKIFPMQEKKFFRVTFIAQPAILSGIGWLLLLLTNVVLGSKKGIFVGSLLVLAGSIIFYPAYFVYALAVIGIDGKTRFSRNSTLLISPLLAGIILDLGVHILRGEPVKYLEDLFLHGYWGDAFILWCTLCVGYFNVFVYLGLRKLLVAKGLVIREEPT